MSCLRAPKSRLSFSLESPERSGFELGVADAVVAIVAQKRLEISDRAY